MTAPDLKNRKTNEIRRDKSRRSEETSGLVQGPSRPRGDRFDIQYRMHFNSLHEFLHRICPKLTG